MTTDPTYDGAEEAPLPKELVAAAQGALDETFNLHTTSPLEDVEQHLRGALADHGAEGLPDGWIEEAAARIRAGEPVVAEPDEPPPGA